MAFVRHPLDRLASAYRDFSQIRGFTGSVKDFLAVVVDDSIPFDDPLGGLAMDIRHHAIPQTHDFNCLSQADFVGRFENYEKDIIAFLELVGSKKSEIPHIRRTEGNPYRDLLSDRRDFELAVEYYKRDFTQLGYKIPHFSETEVRSHHGSETKSAINSELGDFDKSGVTGGGAEYEALMKECDQLRSQLRHAKRYPWKYLRHALKERFKR